MLTAANPGAYYIKHVRKGIEEKKLPVFFTFCNLKMQL